MMLLIFTKHREEHWIIVIYHWSDDIIIGCFCKEGTVLSEEGGEDCVAPHECPITISNDCPEGMVYQDCGTACPTTCDNKDDNATECIAVCVQGITRTSFDPTLGHSYSMIVTHPTCIYM